MDQSRLDDLTRFFAQRTGRRSLATSTLGGLLTAVVPGLSKTGTAAKPKRRSTCKKPRRRCGKTCVNVKTSRQHCGKCNRRCKVGQACRRGKCVPPPPPPACGQGGPCRVFVTSTSYPGDLDGLAGADTKCAQRAQAAGLPGTYRAWLSDDSASPDTRFVHNPGPYVLTNGTRIANTWTDLTDASLLAKIDVMENRQSPEDGPYVWTATLPSGESTSPNCSNWESMSGGATGVRGNLNQTNAEWTNFLGTSCSNQCRLYCFQQS